MSIIFMDNEDFIKRLCKSGKIIYRILKYGFKNNYKLVKDCEDPLLKLNFFYNVLKTPIDQNCFTNQSLVESIFNYIRKIHGIQDLK